jgi:protein gp37
MAAADWHTYHVLTKRSERLRDLLATKLRPFADLPHVWWGVSVEDRAHGLPRVEHLRQAPAAVRFLSVEPLLEDLGEVNLEGIPWLTVLLVDKSHDLGRRCSGETDGKGYRVGPAAVPPACPWPLPG